MALITKIKLTPNYNWKLIELEDITGTGITGYGTNQDPVGNREVIDIGVEIVTTNIYITAPDNTLTQINLDDNAAYAAATTSYIINNTALGFLEDAFITDCIWKVEYVPYFATGSIVTPVTEGQLSFNLSNKAFFVNATRLVLIDEFEDEYNLVITNINFITGIITYTGSTTDMGGIDSIWIGIGTTAYTSITKNLKEYLDNKIADESLNPCDCQDCSLMQKYLLYEAIELNCKQNNYTKANQIFNYLTNDLTNCGC